MLQKLFTLLMLVCVVGTINLYSQNNRPVKIVFNGDAVRGDTGPIPVYVGPPPPIDKSAPKPPVISTDNINTTVVYRELDVNFRTQYNLESNGTIHYLYEDPAHPLDFHAIFMTATIPNTWDDRNVRYSYSNNGGVLWTYNGTVGQFRSGFPCLSQTPDGRALITMHNTDGGSVQNGQLYVDAVEGLGSFTRLNPGLSNPALGNIWEMCAGTNTKAFITGSQNGADSVKTNTTTSYTAPGTWLGWRTDANGSDPGATAQQYAEAIGADGRWGVAFNVKSGGAYLTESTNQGVSWSTPALIRAFTPSDSLGTLRSIDLIYEGSSPSHPRVILGLVKQDIASGGFFPGLPSKTVSWGPDINGGNVVTVDSAAGLSGTNTTNDVFVSCCRGVIGAASDGSALYCTYALARQDTSSLGNNYFDTYMKVSNDHGATWGTRIQLTNLTGQETVLCDYRWRSISPWNQVLAGIQHVYIEVSRDTIPASAVNGAPASTMRAMFLDVTGPFVIGIRNIGNQVPKEFKLEQNYPNPFNPTTKIRFDLPTSGFVTLKIYDVLGKELKTLVNENVSTGTKEVDFDATNFPSGIYFYSIKAGNFTQTKKMILVK